MKKMYLSKDGLTLKRVTKNSEGDIVIPEGVVYLAKRALAGCEYITEVSLPSTLKEIGDEAFEGCISLTSIVIPHAVDNIPRRAFAGCSDLETINLPASLSRIEKEAFCDCDELCSLSIPEGVTSIGDCAFYDCDSLKKVVIPSSVVKGYDSRTSLQYDQPAEDVGFRLVLVGYYMSRRQISQAIADALEISEYKSVYTRVGGSWRLFFDYNGKSATVCPSNPGRPCIMMSPDQVKENTIVVSTDVLRVPQEMDPDDIMDRLIELNSESESEGIRYEAPFLYHANPDMNRAVFVIKEFRAISTAAIILMLPSAIEEVLAATAAFNKLFYRKEQH